MAKAETWKFNENIGKTWFLEGVYHGEDRTHVNKRGVVYVLIRNIVETQTGEVFRDHTHIEVSSAMYDRYFKKAVPNTKVTFTAKTYHYNKEFTVRKNYVRNAIGLTDMNEIKIQQQARKKGKVKPKKKHEKGIGWLLNSIDNEEYKVEEFYYDKLDNETIRKLTVDLLNVLILNRGNQKEFNVYTYEVEGSRYTATLSHIYPDYRILKGKGKKYPNYKDVFFGNVQEAYKSNCKLSRGRMVLTIQHKKTSTIREEYRIRNNNKTEYTKIINMVMRYFNADMPDDMLDGLSYQKVNAEESYNYPPIVKK